METAEQLLKNLIHKGDWNVKHHFGSFVVKGQKLQITKLLDAASDNKARIIRRTLAKGKF